MISKDKFYVSHFTRTFNLEEIIKARALQPINLQKKLNKDFSEPYYYESAEEYGDQKKYAKSVFYSILFPGSKATNFKPIFRTQNEVGELSDTYTYFIFSPKIIEDNAKMVGSRDITEPPVFCNGWTYGKITEKSCRYYDSSISLEENLNQWRNVNIKNIEKYEENPYTDRLIPPESLALPTEILMEGEMPIDLDLLYIYIPKPEFVPGNYPKSFYKKFPDLKDLEKDLKKEYDQVDDEIQKLINKYPELPWTREPPF